MFINGSEDKASQIENEETKNYENKGNGLGVENGDLFIVVKLKPLKLLC